MIYTAPCIMFWMRAYPLLGQVGGGWALEFESFLVPVKWHRAYRRVPFGAPKTPLLLFSPSHSAPSRLTLPLPTFPPRPHLELIRNQQQCLRCIKGRSGS
jgi:hypothetical protein